MNAGGFQPSYAGWGADEKGSAPANEGNPLLVETTLQALSVVAKWDEKLAPNDKRTLDRLRRFVMDSNPRHAKFAARVMACTTSRDDLCSVVVEVNPHRALLHLFLMLFSGDH